MFPPIRRDPDAVGVNERFTPAETAQSRVRGIELQQGREACRAFLERVKGGCAEPPGLEEGCYDPVDGRIRCRAGSASFWITWDGLLTACGMMPEPKVDLTGKAFPDAWRELTQAAAQMRLSGVCARCENRELCHPCAAMAAAETGSTEGVPQYLCHVAKELRRMADEI
jgi:radical SAM protein with 4Fe4S-binding SPASM domain